jgi:hypothetical protein
MIYFGEANPNQTVFSPWVDGGVTTISYQMIDTPNLSALSADVGYLTAGHLHGPVVSGGAFGTSFAWPANGAGGGYHLSASGLLLGNANTPGAGYFEVTSNGDVYAPQFSITGGTATFSGSLSAGIVNTSHLVDRSVTASVFLDTWVPASGNSTGYLQVTFASPSFVLLYVSGTAGNPAYSGWYSAGLGTYQHTGNSNGSLSAQSDFTPFVQNYATNAAPMTNRDTSNVRIALIPAGTYWLNLYGDAGVSNPTDSGTYGGWLRLNLVVIKK